MQRRRFLKSVAAVGAAAVASSRRSVAMRSGCVGTEAAPVYSTTNAQWQTGYDKALSILAGNVQVLPRYTKAVLIEGAEYGGIWQECGPQEALVYRRLRPDVARNGHTVFFALQREDGQLPADNKRTETGFGQIQMVVPIAATAWELARATGDSELLETAYAACSKWDAWLRRYRNTRGTGLVEGFCTYDTGMDNSPRWAGMPRRCPDADARLCPKVKTLPRLCPDLSATVFGGRTALAAMATALGKQAEAAQWTESAEALRRLILDKLYVPNDAAFYDLNAENQFVKIRCAILSRMCGEHVVDQKTFDYLWAKQMHNPKAFWPVYPLPSVALDDPLFVRPIPRNSWGGPSQALTALRAGRWMEHYGRSAEFATMMSAWSEALLRDLTFRQQLDPLTGEFTTGGSAGYSPACLVLYDYTWRLCGVREETSELHWSVRPEHAAARDAKFVLPTDSGTLEMRYSKGQALLRRNGERVARVKGTARLVTDRQGRAQKLMGVSETEQHVTLQLPDRPERKYALKANQVESI